MARVATRPSRVDVPCVHARSRTRETFDARVGVAALRLERRQSALCRERGAPHSHSPKRKGAALRFCVQNPGRVLWLEALNVDDRNDWVEVLQELAGMDHKPAEVAPRN